jgi:hypothetical protein
MTRLLFTALLLLFSTLPAWAQNTFPASGARLKLSLHPDKIYIRKYRQGVDFLGYVSLPEHSRLRTKTQRRMFRKLRGRTGRFKSGEITEDSLEGSLHSYLGVLSHADAHEIREELENQFLFWLKE